MKILVIGSRGFIGRHLVRALRKQKQDVTEFDLVLGGDISKGMVGNYDVIYHLAALSLIHCRGNPQKAIDVNVKGAINVLELARECDAKVIFASASSVYGIPRNDIVNESAIIQPVSIYGATKASAELLIETYHKLYNIDYFIFRFTNVYGPNQKAGVIPNFMNKIKRDEPLIIYGFGKQTRDFVYVDDVVHFLLRAMEEDKKNMTINLGCGMATSIHEIAELCGEVAGRDIAIINRPVEQDERWGFRAELTKCKEIFGDVPMVRLKEGLDKTWESELR